MYEKGGVGTLAEILEFYKSQQADTTMIELLNQTNDILDDIPFRESNRVEGHETRVRTDLPEVYFRRLYRGTPVSKSQWNRVTETLAMLESRMELDVKEKELYDAAFGAYRMSEGKAHTEALRQKAAKLLFYGDHKKQPDEFDGLATRYSAIKAPNVIDAGGKSGKLTSMYLVAWGGDTAHGLFPKNSIGGLQHEDLGRYTTQDAEGYKFEVYADLFKWNIGLAVRDWRSVVRICNIDTEKLSVPAGSEGYIDLKALTIQAKNKMPEAMRNRAIWYVNSDVLTGLEMQSTDSKSVYLHYGEFFGSKGVPMIHFRPVRQCDAISSKEAKVA